MPTVTRTLYIACLLLGLTLPGEAFERRIGARPMGMGDAFSALAADGNASNYNPAGLALVRQAEFSLEYAGLYWGLDDGGLQENHLAYSQPCPVGGLGAAWNNRSISGAYTENEFLLAYAFRAGALPLSLGAAFKVFYLGYTDEAGLATNLYFTDSYTKVQYGLDAGVLYDILDESSQVPGVRAGFSALNVNQPDLGLHAEARQSVELRLGTGVFWGEWDGALDAVWIDSRLELHGGVEKWFADRRWAARAGFISAESAGWIWTLGGSFAFDTPLAPMRLNYACNYAFGGIAETAGIHRLSLDILLPQLIPPVAARPSPPATGAASPEKFVRVREYLFERIDRYLAASRRLRALKASGSAADLVSIEGALHEAAGLLILQQDLLGFARRVDDAWSRLLRIDPGLQADAPGERP